MASVPSEQQSPRSFLAGGAASCVAKTCTAPLSRVTILLQTQTLQLPVILRRPEFVLLTDGNYYYSYRSPDKYPGVLHSLRLVLRQEGFRALWRGNLASCLHRFPYSGTIFFVQGRLKDKLACGDFLAGACAGAIAATAAYPLDVVKTRMATDQKISGVLQTAALLLRDRGLAGLYRGLFPTLLHVTPSLAISFEVYARLRSKHGSRDSSWRANLLCGCASGFSSAALLFPVDLVRRRLQLAENGTALTLKSCSLAIYEKHGLRGFYRGLSAELLKVVPYVGLLFMTVEAINKSLA